MRLVLYPGAHYFRDERGLEFESDTEYESTVIV